MHRRQSRAAREPCRPAVFGIELAACDTSQRFCAGDTHTTRHHRRHRRGAPERNTNALRRQLVSATSTRRASRRRRRVGRVAPEFQGWRVQQPPRDEPRPLRTTSHQRVGAGPERSYRGAARRSSRLSSNARAPHPPQPARGLRQLKPRPRSSCPRATGSARSRNRLGSSLVFRPAARAASISGRRTPPGRRAALQRLVPQFEQLPRDGQIAHNRGFQTGAEAQREALALLLSLASRAP